MQYGADELFFRGERCPKSLTMGFLDLRAKHLHGTQQLVQNQKAELLLQGFQRGLTTLENMLTLQQK